MFKRILAALRGKQADRQPDTDATPSGTPDEDLITVYDAEGHELQITMSDWRDKVFFPNLQQAWDDADSLYNLILSGLNDGLAADLDAASSRLLEIDAMPERSHVTRGIVQMSNGQLDLAEATLRAGIAQVGETAALLTNLAKVQDERSEQALADETLWRAVLADPNFENGMMWWAMIQRERDGDGGYVAALHKVAALPGSYRAQFWLARHHLESGDLAAARALYAQVLAAESFDGRALMMMSGDLGNAGQIPWIAELIGPVYDEKKHDPMAGLNLLRAYLELGRIEEGEALLARMQALGNPTIRQHLDGFAQAFQGQRAGA